MPRHTRLDFPLFEETDHLPIHRKGSVDLNCGSNLYLPVDSWVVVLGLPVVALLVKSVAG